MESKNKPKGNYQNKTNTLCKLTLEKALGKINSVLTNLWLSKELIVQIFDKKVDYLPIYTKGTAERKLERLQF